MLVMALFQGSEANFLEFRGIRPDIVLIMVYCVGLLFGETRGGFAGLGLGLLMDLSSIGSFYQNLVTKGLVGILAGVLGRWLRHAGPFLHLWILFLISLTQGVLIATLLSLLYETSILSDLRTIVLPQAVFDALLGSLILNLLISMRESWVKALWAGQR